ncbi:uncharacterized protein LOC113283005 [Papaver somniferum]|uniref:uncharacterized protein LOC113283005 n=1 Tax=Papaver somniferum TaxID=3469 RepID=UPI000E702AAE|nr:uncharacterized protein LOC113283005 [Papaver somniferum]
MKTLIHTNLIPWMNPKNVSPICCFSFISAGERRQSKTLVVKCSSSENGGLKDVVSGLVDQRVEELLNKEENKVLLDGLTKANERVELAKKELAEFDKKQLEDVQMKNYVNQLESRTSEIEECQREILEAKAMIREAELSLSGNIDEADADVFEENDKNVVEVDKNTERLESVKAASIAAVIGTIAAIPISLSQVTDITELILPLGITFVSCALFGVTFRYTVRRDLDDSHLKSGISAAFACVKGLAVLEAGPRLELDSQSFLSHAVDGAVNVAENLLIFVFASVALDFCFKMRLLSPFPVKRKSVSQLR